MKVYELVNKLNQIGYDKNTELSFSCVDKLTGEWYTLNIDDDGGNLPLGISFGENLTGVPYHNDTIDICLDVDKCYGYIQFKNDAIKDKIVDKIINSINTLS